MLLQLCFSIICGVVRVTTSTFLYQLHAVFSHTTCIGIQPYQRFLFDIYSTNMDLEQIDVICVVEGLKTRRAEDCATEIWKSYRESTTKKKTTPIMLHYTMAKC